MDTPIVKGKSKNDANKRKLIENDETDESNSKLSLQYNKRAKIETDKVNHDDCVSFSKSSSRSESLFSPTSGNSSWQNISNLIQPNFILATNLPPSVPLYNLIDLVNDKRVDKILSFKFILRNLLIEEIKCIKKEDVLCQYSEVPAFKTFEKDNRRFNLFFSSSRTKPDICIEFGEDNPRYPVLIIEMISDRNQTQVNTVSNSLIVMVEQFRYLRMYFDTSKFVVLFYPGSQ